MQVVAHQRFKSCLQVSTEITIKFSMQDWWQATFPAGRQTLTIQDANDRPVTIAYGEKGSGQPLFLVHGVASWSYCWRFNIDALAEHFRVICFDAKIAASRINRCIPKFPIIK